MKSLLKISIYSFLLSFLLSCDKRLDLVPTDSIDDTKAFQTVDDLSRGLMGVYAANNQINKTYIASILADETKISDENRGQGQFQFKWQYSSDDGTVTAAYRQYYTMIDRIHRIQNAIPKVTPANATETALVARIIAELKALKAIAYYESLINFMPPGYDANALGIALVNESCLSCTPARNKVGEVVAEILKFLAEARADANIPNAPTDIVRLSKATIAAYQARVALLSQNWGSAITFATDAMALSGKSLATGSTFVSMWNDASDAEIFWKFRNQTQPTLLWRDTNGDVFFEPSIQLKQLFDRTKDIRFNTFFQSIGTDTSVIVKYKGSSLGATINDLKLVRFAELVLLRAEAYAESDNLVSAAADINLLRTARITGYTPVTFASKSEAVAAILIERTKELCYEGFRYYDLKRKSLPISRLAVDVQSTTWQTLASTDYRFTLPIPQNALDSNPNTIQNPSY